MTLNYREGGIQDLVKLKELALKSWSEFRTYLTDENWLELYSSLKDDETYLELLSIAFCIVCETNSNSIVGMAFLVPSGNPTDIYDKAWSYIRFLTVDPQFANKGLGRKLTTLCIDKAKENNEKSIALHTSELMLKAKHIYESLGFSVLRELDQRLSKRYWLYKLDLP